MNKKESGKKMPGRCWGAHGGREGEAWQAGHKEDEGEGEGRKEVKTGSLMSR